MLDGTSLLEDPGEVRLTLRPHVRWLKDHAENQAMSNRPCNNGPNCRKFQEGTCPYNHDIRFTNPNLPPAPVFNGAAGLVNSGRGSRAPQLMQTEPNGLSMLIHPPSHLCLLMYQPSTKVLASHQRLLQQLSSRRKARVRVHDMLCDFALNGCDH